MSIELRQRFPHSPSAPAAARDAVDAALGGRVDGDALAELRLLVSEVVTNAIRHGRDRDGAVELGLALRDDMVRVEVADGGCGFAPPGREPKPGHAGGWGLVVVDRLAERWGIENVDETRVWLEFGVGSARLDEASGSLPGAQRNV